MIKLSLAAETIDELREKLANLNSLLNNPANDLHQVVKDYLSAPTPAGLPSIAPVTTPVTAPVEPAAPTAAPMPVIPSVTSDAAPAQPAAPPAASPAAPPTVPPTAPAPAYRFEDLARACCQLSDGGRVEELQGLFEQYGIKGKGLTTLPPAQYGAFATSLRSLGVVI